jgi:NRAMP (natural resistance-associated macrophage protein)-like metal ion transporter
VLAFAGPGLIAANAGNDAGGIATYASAGARFGYRTLFVMLLVTVGLVVVQEMCARLGAHTGEGLGSLIREQFSVRVTGFALVAFLAANVGLVVSEFAGIAAALSLFGVPVPIGALLAAVAVLVVTGTLATASGRFPGSSGSTVVSRIWMFHSAVWLHVRAVAAFGIVFLALAGWAWLRRREFPWLLRGCAVLLAILLGQMAVGELQYRTYGTVAWWVVVIHVAAAAALLGWTVGLVARLWRPAA